MKSNQLLLSPLLPIRGVRLGTTEASIKQPNRPDLVLLELAEGTTTAAVFTQNDFCAAPVTLAKSHLQTMSPRFMLINTGYANAGMGKRGVEDASNVCCALANQLNCQTESILPFSTGVIGEPLPVEKITTALPKLCTGLDESGWERAALGIMTTDTEPKGMSVECEINGETITITGIVKGAGMIKPNMATMLAFVATDAVIEQPALQEMLLETIEESFHAITVDGDTSTNDAVVLMATGQSGVSVTPSSNEASIFQKGLKRLFQTLAQSIIRDAEGATKFIEIEVSGAPSTAVAKQVAFKVAHSPLVKTACYASDPNWGRILSAVGNAGVQQLELDRVSVSINHLLIAAAGMRVDDYDEASVQKEMQKSDINIQIDLGSGTAISRVWTSDLSYDYVKINAEYRT